MPEKLVKAAVKTDIPETNVKAIEIEGRKIAICRVDGNFYAIDDQCTHARADLATGALVGNEIECPLHGARFDVKTGKALCLPAVRPVATYRVEEKGDELWIAIPE